MPNRIIRESILTSDRVESLDVAAEVFYRRLLSKVDDYGRFDARPSILRASLFALRIDRVTEADCVRWMAECQAAGLIVLYSHDGKPYLEVANTGWQARSPSKYPDPLDASANICAQVKTNAHLYVVVDVGVDEVVGVAPPKGGFTFTTWTKRLEAEGKQAVPADHAVFAYADKVGIPSDFLRLAWLWFEKTYGQGGGRSAKKYTKWAEVFQRSVEENWSKVWFLGPDGYKLSTVGLQLQREMDVAA